MFSKYRSVDVALLLLSFGLVFAGGPPCPVGRADALSHGVLLHHSVELQTVLAPGDLDPSFGGAGRVTTDFPGGSDEGRGLAVQPDGKIVVVGTHNGQFATVRYNSNGTPDAGFGDSGIVTTDFSPNPDGAGGIALQSDGKIVVIGTVFNDATNRDFALVRYNSNGTIDTSFGNSGKTTTDFTGGSDDAAGVAIQSDGKIVVVGASSGSTLDIALARYNVDGTLDPSFGTSGKTTFNFAVFNLSDFGAAVAIQVDGKIVVAGTTANGFNNDFAVVRFNSNGTPDTSFGLSGRRNIFFAGLNDSANAVAIQSDGKIVVGGSTGFGDFALVRLGSSGFEDSSFGSSGKVTTDISGISGDDSLKGLLIQPDGRIVAAGRSQGATDHNFTLVRYNSNGTLDTSFGTDGKLTTDFFGDTDVANGVALQSDGSIVAAGYAINNNVDGDFAVARYTPTGSLDTNFDGDGKLTTGFPSGIDSGYAVAIQPDGKIVVAGQHNVFFGLARYNGDGSLDSSFGTGGRVVTVFQRNSITDSAFAVAIQPDGKIVAAGKAQGQFNDDFALVRYNTDGSLDPSFGIGGKVTTNFSSADAAFAIALQSDGKIVVAGNGGLDYALARYNTDGSLDPSFNSSGRVVTNFSGTDTAFTVAIQPDGKILAAGSSGTASSLTWSFIRYLSNGSFDTGFGTGGGVLLDFSGPSESAKAMSLQPDGKIVAAGYALGTSYNFAVARLNPNGSLDTTFGTGGGVITDFAGSTDAVNGVSLRSDGKITTAGYAFIGASFDFAIAQYNANGSLDTSFGLSGKVTTDFAGSTDIATAMLIQPDGKSVAVGYSYSVSTNYDFSLARYDGGANCTISIAPTSQSFSSSGGAGAISVTASDSTCAWSVSNTNNWVAITSGNSGTGSGVVNYSIAANTGTARTGTMTIAGQTFTVTQDSGCTFSISTTSQNFTASGGTGSVAVTASDSGCNWTATSNDSWITVTSSSSGTGSGTVGYSVATNSTCGSRTGTMTVAGQIFTVTQDAASCTFTINPTNQSFTESGGTGSVAVTASQSCCTWTATSNAAWIIITSGASGTGNGTVGYSVAANTGAARTGSMTIAGQTFTVTQASGCTFSISSTSQNFAASGGTGNVNVTAGSGCTWTATSNAPWIAITSGASGAGDGTVGYSVAANSTCSSRTGTMTIAGQTFTVTQDAASCTFTISPTNQSFSASGGTGSVAVTASQTCCTWTATSNDAWITITSGASGTGNGTVNYSVAANSGSSRVGTITIAGQTFTVTQGSGCAATLSPLSASYSSTGGTGSVAVTIANGCSWAATSNDAWITITSGASGSGNGVVNYAVAANIGFVSRTGSLTVAGQTFTVGQSAAPAVGLGVSKTDFDGDGKAELGFYRAGLWGFLKSTQSYSYASPLFFSWGGATLLPIAADFDGDGKSDIAYIIPSSGGQSAAYAILKSSTGYSFAQALFFPAGFPSIGDTPVVGDFDGDGKADPAIWRSSLGFWMIPNSSTGYASYIFSQWGQAGDIPVVADLDGDGKADLGFYRDGLWGFLKSSQSYSLASAQFFSWGGAGLQPIIGDFDGDQMADLAYMVPPAGGQSAAFAILKSSTGYSFAQTQFIPAGYPSLGDTPVVGDYDGDGKADPGIWRESQGVWFLPLSSASYTSYIITQWGQPGDVAFPNTTGKH